MRREPTAEELEEGLRWYHRGYCYVCGFVGRVPGLYWIVRWHLNRTNRKMDAEGELG